MNEMSTQYVSTDGKGNGIPQNKLVCNESSQLYESYLESKLCESQTEAAHIITSKKKSQNLCIRFIIREK